MTTMSHIPTAAAGLMIDAENVPASHADAILAVTGPSSRLKTARFYGDIARLKGWVDIPGLRGIHTDPGRNAADIAICIDAMELALTGGLRQIYIATSDSDFTLLAMRLRELGVTVTGLGEEKASARFRAACSAFHELKTEPRLAKWDAELRSTIIENGGCLRIALLGSLMGKRGCLISKHPEKTWRAYLTARPGLFQCDPKGPDARVRWVGPKG